MAQKLHAIVALRDGIQSRAHKAISELHKLTQKRELYDGFEKSYKSKYEDGGDQLPPEAKTVQLRASAVLDGMIQTIAPYIDLMATQDRTNQEARADVIVTTNGQEETILQSVPTTHLLFLEKQLDDIRTFITKLPTLDPAKQWMYDPAADIQRTGETVTVRNKKTPRNHVLASATERHPAQVQMYYEDVLEGYWTTTNFSGALLVSMQRELLTRVNVLSNAVKEARQRANSTDVVDLKVAKQLFDFILGI